MSTSATAAPSSANSRAVASPIPPPPPVTSATRPAMRPGMRSGERELLVVADEYERARRSHPVGVRREHEGGGAHTERPRVSAGRRLGVVAQRAGAIHQATPHLDDRGVTRAQALLRAIH